MHSNQLETVSIPSLLSFEMKIEEQKKKISEDVNNRRKFQDYTTHTSFMLYVQNQNLLKINTRFEDNQART